VAKLLVLHDSIYSAGRLFRDRRFRRLSNSIVAVVVSSTFMGVLLLWTDESSDDPRPACTAWDATTPRCRKSHMMGWPSPSRPVAGFVWLQISAAPSVDWATLHAERHQRSPARSSIRPSSLREARARCGIGLCGWHESKVRPSLSSGFYSRPRSSREFFLREESRPYPDFEAPLVDVQSLDLRTPASTPAPRAAGGAKGPATRPCWP